MKNYGSVLSQGKRDILAYAVTEGEGFDLREASVQTVLYKDGVWQREDPDIDPKKAEVKFEAYDWWEGALYELKAKHFVVNKSGVTDVSKTSSDVLRARKK